jgi:hypothetical protein
MATSIFFNGRVISVPGSYSEVDATGLETVGLGAAGIVGLIGTVEGGRPVTDIEEVDDFIRVTKPEQANTLFRSGDVKDAIPMLFAPANDENILGGAVEVVVMKINPATQSSSQFSNAQGPAMDVESRDWGAFTEQINVSIADGTTQGKLLTIVFEDQVEAVDDLGGDDIFLVKYKKPTDGWDTMTAEVLAGGIVQANATRDVGGLDGDVGTPAGAVAVDVVSTSGSDVGQVVTVYGLDGTGTPQKETFVLNGTTAQVGSQVWGAGDVLGVAVTGTIVGTVTVEPTGGGAAIFSLAPAADPVKGLVRGVAMSAASLVTLVADGATVKDVIVVGTSSTGAQILEKITLTGAVAVDGVGVFSNITAIVLGDVEAARTVTASAIAVKTDPAIQSTIQKVADYYNARQVIISTVVYGFIFTIETGLLSFDPANLDVSLSAVNCLDPAEPGFKADLWTMVDWINQNSALISAAIASGATGGAPDNTAAPIFLVGGSEGTAAFSNYQTALNLLKQVRVNSIVPLTGDPAVHSALEAHCSYMGGIGRSERDGFVGLLNTGLNGLPTKTEIKSQIVSLNSRHIRALGQSINKFDAEGVQREFWPPFHACIAAGMQAGSSVGESLTYKFANVLGFKQDNSWNPTDDAEELIQAGLMFLENVEGVGRRYVRNITTHLSSNNIAFTEGSVNEATNFATFNFRTNLEFAVGKKGFAGTVNATKGIAIGTLGLLVDAEVLVDWRSLQIELLVDVLEVGVEIAPVIPINFVKSTVHLVTVAQTAA